MNKKALIQSYIEGWKQGSVAKILAPLADSCTIIESHGPHYHGKEAVRKWVEDWNRQGNKVEKWDMTSFHEIEDGFVCEWDFSYRGKNIQESFSGITIAYIHERKIAALKEYRMVK
jgi:hypothetical protein